MEMTIICRLMILIIKIYVMLNLRIITRLFCLFGFFAFSSTSYAAPNIENISGQTSHGQNFIISGIDFGTKSQASPLVWDSCTEANLNSLWDDFRPQTAVNPVYNIQYREAGFRGVGLAHDHSSKFITGGHCQSGYSSWNAGGGPNVQVIKDYPPGADNFYISFYYRLDPLWPPNNGEEVFSSVNDKLINFSSTIPNNLLDEHYIGYHHDNPSQWDFKTMGMDVSGYWPGEQEGRWASQPWGWRKIELLGMDVRNYQNGKLYVWTDNELDFIRENMRVFSNADVSIHSFAVGFYWSRCNGCNPDLGSDDAFRYFSDIYLDTTPSRVVLANNQSYQQSTIVEPQIPSAWSDN